MKQAEWESCADASKMLRLLDLGNAKQLPKDNVFWRCGISNRKLRLFAVAVSRLIPSASDIVSGLCDQAEKLAEDNNDVSLIYDYQHPDAREVFWIALSPMRAARDACITYAPEVSALLRANLLREIVNPYYQLPGDKHIDDERICEKCGTRFSSRPPQCTTCGSELIRKWRQRDQWLTPDIKALARQAYDNKDWDSLPILADLLEESGWPMEMECPRCEGEGGNQPDAMNTWDCGYCKKTGKVPDPLLKHLRNNTVKQQKTVNTTMRCPKCNSGGRWRSGGPHFEHERICTAKGCWLTWEPGQPIDIVVDVPFAHCRGCWSLDMLLDLP